MTLKKRPNKFFYILTLLVFLAQLALPTGARAEGETPPADPAVTEVAPVDAATPEPAPAATETPAAEPVIDLSIVPDGTEVIVLDDQGAVLPLATQAAADAIATADPQWCPDGVTPGSGSCIGIGSTSMAALLTAIGAGLDGLGDGTIWIETAYVSANDTSKITINSTNTHSLTLKGGWDGGTSITTPGVSTFTVPIEIFWGGAVTINNISVNGSTYTVEAGKGAGVVEAMLNVKSTAVDPSATTSAVTLNNVTVTKSKGTTGTVNDNAEVSFAAGEAGHGAKITTTLGGVTVSRSTFTDNNHDGLLVLSHGPVTLSTITAYGNGGQRDLTSGEITAVEAAHHTGQSPDSLANWDVTDSTNKHIIDDVTYYNHVWWGSGVQVSADTGNVSVSSSTFGDTPLAKANKDSGLVVNASAGNITLTKVTSYGNFGYGADLFASAGNILVEESDFLNTLIYKMGDAGTGGDLLGWWDHANYWNNGTLKADWKWQGSGAGGIGLSAYGSGDITLNKIHAGLNDIGNQYSGANLASYNGQISVTDSEFIENGISGSVYGGGLFADSGLNWQTGALSCVVSGGCDITLTNVTVNENYGSGAEIFAYGGGVTVQDTSTFNLNGGTGLTAEAGNWDTGYCPAGSVCDLTITDAIASENGGDGVYLDNYFGNIVVDNVTATGNDATGANLGNEYGGNVTVSNSHFNSNSAGVYVETAQDETCNSGLTCNITLTNIEGNDNTDGNGAELYTDASGNISVSNSFFNSNDGNGLNATSSYSGCDSGPCNVTITNIIANDNDRGGADLNTNYGGSITVNGGTFNGNTWDGLYLATAIDDCLPGMVCDITMNGVTAQNNGWEGANLGTEMGGKITVNGGTFTNNEYGLSAEVNEDNETNLSGAVKFDSVTATGNLYSGASITLYKNGGTVEVTNSVFNLNGNNGLFVDSYSLGTAAIPEIFLNGVTASQNAAKGFFYYGPTPTGTVGDPTPANILICSGSYNDNSGYGVNIDNFGGSTAFGGSVVSTGNNLTGVEPGENWLNPEASLGDCQEVSVSTPSEPGEHKLPVKEWVFVKAANGNVGDFASCGAYAGLHLGLEPQDFVEIPCESRANGKRAFAETIAASSLPTKPEGTFLSALTFSVRDALDTELTQIGRALVSFKLAAGDQATGYSILFWDGKSWVKMGNAQLVNGQFQTWTNQPGLYVLVKN